MRSRTTIALSVGVLLALALIFAWRGLRSARQAGASLAALAAQLTRLDQNLQHEREQAGRRRRRADVLRSELNAAPATEVSLASSAVHPPAIHLEAETLMASDPNLRTLYLSSFRANFSLRHDPMYQALGLTPSQIRTLEDLAAARADDRVTLKAAAVAQGLAESDPGLAALQKQTDDRFYAAVATEVSEAAADQTRQFDRLTAAQDLAFMANNLNATGPQNLTSAQTAQLTQLLVNASAAYQSGGNADKDSIDWDSVYQKADTALSGTLSGQQLQNFKSTVEFFKFSKTVRQIRAQSQPGVP